MIRPRVLLSGKTLASAGSRAARRFVAALDAEPRAQQLCAIEALAQLAAWQPGLRPDQVVPYAGGDVITTRTTLHADHAAFHGATGWTRLRFECQLNASRTQVQRFAFAVGTTITATAARQSFVLPKGAPLD